MLKRICTAIFVLFLGFFVVALLLTTGLGPYEMTLYLVFSAVVLLIVVVTGRGRKPTVPLE